jgi:hypothetical protein
MALVVVSRKLPAAYRKRPPEAIGVGWFEPWLAGNASTDRKALSSRRRLIAPSTFHFS